VSQIYLQGILSRSADAVIPQIVLLTIALCYNVYKGSYGARMQLLTSPLGWQASMRLQGKLECLIFCSQGLDYLCWHEVPIVCTLCIFFLQSGLTLSVRILHLVLIWSASMTSLSFIAQNRA